MYKSIRFGRMIFQSERDLRLIVLRRGLPASEIHSGDFNAAARYFRTSFFDAPL